MFLNSMARGQRHVALKRTQPEINVRLFNFESFTATSLPVTNGWLQTETCFNLTLALYAEDGAGVTVVVHPFFETSLLVHFTK